MKLAVYFNGTKPCYSPKDQGKFDLSCHDPLKTGGAQELQILGVIGINSLFYQLTVTTYTL